MNSAPVVSSAKASIFDAAVRLFGEQGYTGTSMRDIARAVGVLPGSLYAHIDSKETLLSEIVDEGITSFLHRVEPLAASDEDALGRMRAAIKAHIEVVGENPERSQVVFHQWRFLDEPNLSRAIEKRRRYEHAFVQILDSGVRTGVFNPRLSGRIAVFTLLGALNWTPQWYSPTGSATPSEIGEIMADTLITGLTNPPSR